MDTDASWSLRKWYEVFVDGRILLHHKVVNLIIMLPFINLYFYIKGKLG
jgi:hypothetical protein